jgi:glycosyltransferase involved in cell wall biosynthesis
VACLDKPDARWLADFPLPCHALGVTDAIYGYSPKLIPWLQANVQRFDAVIVHGLWQHHSLAAWKVLCKTGIPYFVYPHGMLDPWFKRTYPLKHLKKWLYWPWADYRVLRDAKAVLFTSEDERRLARESFWLYRCNERVVNYGTAGPAAGPEAEAEAFWARFPELRGKRCVLFLGRVHVKKGPDLLLKAFAARSGGRETGGGKMHLVFAGPNDHAYGQEMAALADSLGLAGQVTWTGMLTGPAKWAALRAAEVFVLPSHQENFGIAVAEALACGRPVLISTGINIWREVIADGAGLAEEPTQAGAERLLSRWQELPAEERAAMGVAARRCFEQRFSIERVAESLLGVFRESGVNSVSRY